MPAPVITLIASSAAGSAGGSPAKPLERPTPTLTNLAKYCHELYASLEEGTGQATGYRRIGRVASRSTLKLLCWRFPVSFLKR